jgi:hypothetical protein
MKKITETALLNSVKLLREKLAIIEGGFNANTRQDAFGDVPDAIGATDHPMQNFSDYMNQGKDNVNNAVGDLASGIGHSIGDPLKKGIPIAKEIGRGIGAVGQGVGTALNRAAHGDFADHPEDHPENYPPLGLTNPEQYPDLSAAGSYDLPHADAAPHEFNPSGTSYAQDHPAPAKPHPAGQPKSPGAKFDPAVQKIQYELQAKGYPIKADGILGPKTQQAIDWENKSQSTQDKISGYDQLRADMDQSTAAPEPFDNTQGDFDHTDAPMEIPYDPNAIISESVTFKQEDSLARIIQLARG